MTVGDIQNLKIYQTALLLVKEIYVLTRNNTQLAKDYSLCDQLRRASISVVANIAEGYLRTRKQCKNYLAIASGSANEVLALLQVVDLVYDVNTSELQEKFRIVGKQIMSFSNHLSRFQPS